MTEPNMVKHTAGSPGAMASHAIMDLASVRRTVGGEKVVRLRPPSNPVVPQIMAVLRNRPKLVPYVATFLDLVENWGEQMRDVALGHISLCARACEGTVGDFKDLIESNYELIAAGKALERFIARRKARVRPAGRP